MEKNIHDTEKLLNQFENIEQDINKISELWDELLKLLDDTSSNDK